MPWKLFLEVLGLPKLSIFVVVRGRLPICALYAPKLLLEVLGLPKLFFFCRRPWQTADLRFLCPKNVFRGAGLA